ncbi:MAG: hypothetical protein ACRD4L_05755, partial [Pyrinomonadaceae bacterium]
IQRIHIHIQARQLSGKKINLKAADYRSLDEKWGVIYAKEFGDTKLKEHLAKKRETAEYKKAKALGKDVPVPKRSNSKQLFNQVRERERRDYGYQTGTRNDQRSVAIYAEAVESRKSIVERFTDASNLADQTAKDTVRDTKQLRQEFATLGKHASKQHHPIKITR